MAVAVDGYSSPARGCCCTPWLHAVASAGLGRVALLYEVELRNGNAVVPASRVLSLLKRGSDSLGTTQVDSGLAGSSVADGS